MFLPVVTVAEKMPRMVHCSDCGHRHRILYRRQEGSSWYMDAISKCPKVGIWTKVKMMAGKS